MTPEALKLLAVVLGRDGGFFDIKANVAARTLPAHRISRQAVPSDDHTDGPHRSGAWQQGEAGRVTAPVRSSRMTSFTARDAPPAPGRMRRLGALLGPEHEGAVPFNLQS